MPFWKYLDETVYNSWQASKFKEKAMQDISEQAQHGIDAKAMAFTESQGPAQQITANGQPPQFPGSDPWAQAVGNVQGQPPQAPAMTLAAPSVAPQPQGGMPGPTNAPMASVAPQGAMTVPGASIGGAVKSGLRKVTGLASEKVGDLFGLANDATGGALGVAGQGIKTGLDAYQNHVVAPLAGTLEGLTGNNLFRLNPINGQALTQDIFGKGSKKNTTHIGLDGFKPVVRMTDGTTKSVTQNYKDSSTSDQLISGALADPLTYLGGYGEVAKNVPLLSKAAPAISAVEKAPFNAVDKGLSGISSGIGKVVSKTPGLEVLGRESVGSQAARAGQEAGNAARVRIDSHGDFASNFWGVSRPTVEAHPAIKAILDRVDPETGQKLRNLLNVPAGGHAAATSPQDFAQAAQRTAQRATRTDLQAGIKAARASRNSITDKLANAGDKVVDTVYRGRIPFGKSGAKLPSIEDVNKGIAIANLGTFQYPVGNFAEDAVVSHAGGVSPGFKTPEQFAKALKGVNGDIPLDLFMKDASSSGASRAAGVSTKSDGLMGYVTGKKWMELSGQMSDPVRRNFIQEMYAKTGDINKTMDLYRKLYPEAAKRTNFDEVMQAAVPFWNYSKSRWPRVARLTAADPELATNLNRINNNSDRGYFDSPGGFQFNPLRGTLASPIENLGKPDFPSYDRGKSGSMEKFADNLGKGGFWLGPAAGLATQAVAGLEGQPTSWGDAVIPGAALRVPRAIEAAGNVISNPISDAVTNFEGKTQDRFREYYVNKELAAQGIEPEKATPEQHQKAAQTVALRMGLMTDAGVLRYKPPAEQEYKDKRLQEAINNGVPQDIAEGLSKKGQNPLHATDANGKQFLNAAQVREIYDKNPDFQNWLEVSNPLRHPDDLAVSKETQGYFGRLDTIDKSTEAQLQQVYDELNNGGSWQDARHRRSDVMTRASAARDEAQQESASKGALVNDQNRADFYKKTGREQPTTNPLDDKARQYYSIEPPQDQYGNQDYSAFKQQRDQFLSSLSPQERDYVQNQYPRKKYQDNPTVLQGEAAYKGNQAQASEYSDIPKYLGISKEQEAALTLALNQVSLLQQTYPGMKRNQVMAMVAGQNPTGAALLPIAHIISNPARQQYLRAHPELAQFWSDAPSDTQQIFARR